jgi:hypothetical protein
VRLSNIVYNRVGIQDTILDTSCFILALCYYPCAGQNKRSMKGISRSPMLQTYTRPTRETVTRKTRKQRYIQNYVALPEQKQREAQLMIMTMIAEAIARLRATRGEVPVISQQLFQ